MVSVIRMQINNNISLHYYLSFIEEYVQINSTIQFYQIVLPNQ